MLQNLSSAAVRIGTLRVKIEQQSIMVHHRKYPLFTFDFYLWVKVTQNVSQYPLHHVTFASANFEVAMSNGLGDAFTRKYII